MHFEHTVLRGGSDLFCLHGSTEQKAPADRPGAPLAVVIPAMPMLSVRKVRLPSSVSTSSWTAMVKSSSFISGRSATSTHACSCSSRSTRGVHVDSRMPDGGVLPAKDSKSRSISCLSDSMPSKGLHGCWNGLHGMVGFHRTTAIVPLLLPHPCCRCGSQ